MHGNVWEWVEDCWNDNYAGAPSDGSTWTDGDCSKRVLRGGSWLYTPTYLRSANRGKYPPGKRYNNVGFRVVRTL
jgi:formylglycine-generating enzyme required for sulfatase activity